MTDPARDSMQSTPDEATLNSPSTEQSGHSGVIMTGAEGETDPKAFFIEIEALPGHEDDVMQMLRDILACVNDEPATGPWYAVRRSQLKFAIFEVFPDSDGRQAHVDGGGGDIFRDVERMNCILASPAHVQKVDVLLSKQVFTFGT